MGVDRYGTMGVGVDRYETMGVGLTGMGLWGLTGMDYGG